MSTPSRVHIPDVEWLLECDPSATPEALAPRFGVKADSLLQALRRADRDDMAKQLKANSERFRSRSQPERRAW